MTDWATLTIKQFPNKIINFAKIDNSLGVDLWRSTMQRNFLVLAAVFYVLPLIKFLYFISRHFLGVLISASQKIMSRSNRSQEPVSFFYNALAFIAEVEYYFQFFRFLCVGVPVILWWLVSTITLLTGHHGSLGVPSYIGLFFLAMLVFWHAGQKKMAD